MQDKIQIFNSVYDTYSFMGLPTTGILQHVDFNIVNLKDCHPDLPFKSIGFRPGYFSFLFVKKGKGQYSTDNLTFETEPGTIYFTNPGHFKSFIWYEIEEIFLITFTESFLKKNTHQAIFEEFPFLLAETVFPKVLDHETFQEFETLYQQIYLEFRRDSPYRQKLMGNLLVIILLKIKEYFWQEYNPIYEGNKSSQIVKKFKQNLENHFRKLVKGLEEKPLRVQDYADLQNLHPGYLTNVIKTKTGKSISTWIAEKMIIEAKSLLQNSPMSIKEISYLLGFTETTHFSNYFRKNTDTSPAQFRKNASS